MRKVLFVFIFAIAPAIAQAQQAETPAPPAECCAAQTAAKACTQCQAATTQVAVKACTQCEASQQVATKACTACQTTQQVAAKACTACQSNTQVAAKACTACQTTTTVAKVDDASCCLSSQQVVMYSFSAPWCGPCQEMKKTLADTEVVKTLAGHCKVVKVNIDDQPETAAKFGITSIPAQVFVTPDGKVIKKIVGLQKKEQLIAAAKEAAPQQTIAAQTKASPYYPLDTVQYYAPGKEVKLSTSGPPTITIRKRVEGDTVRSSIQAHGDHKNVVTVVIGDKHYRIQASKIEIEEKDGVIRLQCEGAKLTTPAVAARVIRVEGKPAESKPVESKPAVRTVEEGPLTVRDNKGNVFKFNVEGKSEPPAEKPHPKHQNEVLDANANVFFWKPAQDVATYVENAHPAHECIEVECCEDVLVKHGVLKDAPGNQTAVIRVRNVPAINIAKSVSSLLNVERDLHVGHVHCESGHRVIVMPEPITNSLIVTATNDHLEDVKAVVRVLDQCKPACPTEAGANCTKPVHEANCAAVNVWQPATSFGLQEVIAPPATECPAGACTECPDAGACPVCPAMKGESQAPSAVVDFWHATPDFAFPHPPHAPHAVMAAPVSLFNPFVAKPSEPAAPAKGSYCVVTTQGERHAYAGEFVRMNEEFVIVKENGTTHWIPRHSVECLSVKEEQLAEAPKHPVTATRQVFPHPVTMPYSGTVHRVLPSPPAQALPPAPAAPSVQMPAPPIYRPVPVENELPKYMPPAPVSYAYPADEAHAVPAKSMYHIELQVRDGDDVITRPHLMTLEHQRATVQVGSTEGPCFYAGVEVQAIPNHPDAYAVNMFNAAGTDKPCVQTVCKSGEGVQVPWQVGNQTFEVTMMVREHQGDKSCCEAAPKQAVQTSFELPVPKK